MALRRTLEMIKLGEQINDRLYRATLEKRREPRRWRLLPSGDVVRERATAIASATAPQWVSLSRGV